MAAIGFALLNIHIDMLLFACKFIIGRVNTLASFWKDKDGGGVCKLKSSIFFYANRMACPRDSCVYIISDTL